MARGELFTLGRDYLAGGITIEMSPLIYLTPNMFVNLGDGSGLAKVVGQYDFKQNWQGLLALNLPFGGSGTEFGGLDVLFNNAGVFHDDDVSVVDTDEAVWDFVMNVNAKGVFLGCKYGIPALLRRGGGSLINTSSMVALIDRKSVV